MVLCVSKINWIQGGKTDDGVPVEPRPELEVTDGWYRLRAQIDGSLVRAVKKGVLRVGRKIGVAGARVCMIFLACTPQSKRRAVLINLRLLAFVGAEGSDGNLGRA
jgi:hypothetical protein